MKPTWCIYRLTHNCLRVTYIGATGDLRQRMKTRFSSAIEREVFRDVDDWDCEVLAVADSLEEAARVEARFIAESDPLESLNSADAALGLRTAVPSEWHRVGPVDLRELMRSPIAAYGTCETLAREIEAGLERLRMKGVTNVSFRKLKETLGHRAYANSTWARGRDIALSRVPWVRGVAGFRSIELPGRFLVAS